MDFTTRELGQYAALLSRFPTFELSPVDNEPEERFHYYERRKYPFSSILIDKRNNANPGSS